MIHKYLTPSPDEAQPFRKHPSAISSASFIWNKALLASVFHKKKLLGAFFGTTFNTGWIGVASFKWVIWSTKLTLIWEKTYQLFDTPYETKINSNLILNFTYFCRKIPIVGTIGGELFQLGKFRHYISMLLLVKSMVGG